MSGRRRLLVALVVTGRAASEVDGLRRALASPSLGRIPPHVTLVPPVNVASDARAEVDRLLRAAASAHRPVEVELGPPATFAPRTPVVYLALAGELDALAELRGALAAGPLADPVGRARRAFVPHVTVASRIEPARIPVVLDALGSFRLETTLWQLALFEQDETAARRPWRAVADLALGGARVVGRGGRELAFVEAERLDEQAARWSAAAWEAYSEATYGPAFVPDAPFALAARHDGRLVATATGSVRGRLCVLDRLIVSPAHRGEGIGGQLLAEVERLAHGRGCERVRLLTRARGAAATFYARRGYLVAAELPAWREGQDFLVLERRLGR